MPGWNRICCATGSVQLPGGQHRLPKPPAGTRLPLRPCPGHQLKSLRGLVPLSPPRRLVPVPLELRERLDCLSSSRPPCGPQISTAAPPAGGTPRIGLCLQRAPARSRGPVPQAPALPVPLTRLPPIREPLSLPSWACEVCQARPQTPSWPRSAARSTPASGSKQDARVKQGARPL